MNLLDVDDVAVALVARNDDHDDRNDGEMVHDVHDDDDDVLVGEHRHDEVLEFPCALGISLLCEQHEAYQSAL